jgi:alpha-L-fucosidase 2
MKKMPVQFNGIEYFRRNGTSLSMDALVPDGPGPHPAAILVHGGGWMRGDRTWNLEPLFRPLIDAGLAWFSISYRLAKDFLEIGAASDDILEAVAHLRSNANSYGIDRNRIGLVGESAGAHLATLATLANPGPVRAVVSLAGPQDLERLAHTSSAVPDQVRAAVRGSALANMLLAHLRSLSPMHLLRSEWKLPPFLFVHGTADTIVPFEQSELFRARLNSLGFSAETIPVMGGSHPLRTWHSHRPGWQGEVADWLRRVLCSVRSVRGS